MNKTIIGDNIEKEFIGYMINAEFSDENKAKIFNLQNEIVKKFGSAVWCQPPHSLHITLLDWLAPLSDYGEDKDKLFEKIYPEYDRTITTSLKGVAPITINFRTIEAAPSAIFAIGTDEGQFQTIRKYFLDEINLLPNTKLPPTIIHFTICRFLEEIDFEAVQHFVRSLNIKIEQNVTKFRLVREQVDPMIDFRTIKEYELG